MIIENLALFTRTHIVWCPLKLYKGGGECKLACPIDVPQTYKVERHQVETKQTTLVMCFSCQISNVTGLFKPQLVQKGAIAHT